MEMAMPIRPEVVTNIAAFTMSHPGVPVVDAVATQLNEYAAIENIGASDSDLLAARSVYYFVPWRSAVVRMLPAEEYARLLESRNRVLFSLDDIARIGASSIG